MLVLDAMWAWGRERWEKERSPIRSVVRPREEHMDGDASLDSSTSNGAACTPAGSAEAPLDENEKPRRRVVVQV